MVQEKNDIKLAMEFLKECPSVKVEDILPFFPDFVTIDHFKAAICDSLQQYTEHIDQLKKDMIEASGSARIIREEIAEARNQHQFVRQDFFSNDGCKYLHPNIANICLPLKYLIQIMPISVCH